MGRHLLWACLLGGWLGLVCSLWCLRFLVLARQLGGGVLCVSPPRLGARLALTCRVWARWRGRWFCVPGWSAMLGRDMIVPPHAAWRAVPGCCVAWGERRGVWGARRVLTRARAHAERGASWGGTWWPGWGRGWHWRAHHLVHTIPSPGSRGWCLPHCRVGRAG